MRPPKAWTSFIDEIWMLVKPDYGLIEPGRLWKFCIEEWWSYLRFTTILGLPQLFILRRHSRICIFIAKVVDDIPIAGTREESSRVCKHLSKMFKVRLHSQGTNIKIKLNVMTLSQNQKFNISVNMHEYLYLIEPISLSPARRKISTSPIINAELRDLRAIPGTLNFLGHVFFPKSY